MMCHSQMIPAWMDTYPTEFFAQIADRIPKKKSFLVN